MSTFPAASTDHEESCEGDSAIFEASDRSRVRTGPKMKLPKINLPRFKGDPYILLGCLSMSNELTKVDKFNYLLSLLDCSVLDAIMGLTLSSANYSHAIEILQKRFGNTESISSDCYVKDLRQLFYYTESHIQSLKSLGTEASSYGTILTPVLLSKLPSEM